MLHLYSRDSDQATGASVLMSPRRLSREPGDQLPRHGRRRARGGRRRLPHGQRGREEGRPRRGQVLLRNRQARLNALA